MAFQISPGVNVSEVDLTTVVPAVQTTTGAIAGVFSWGPVDQATLIDSEINLAKIYGKPSDLNPETWWTAANFLGYGNSLYAIRVANTTLYNANSTTSAYANSNTVANTYLQTIKNRDDYDVKAVGGFDANAHYIARYPGVLGNSLKVSVCSNANQYLTAVAVSNVTFTVGAQTAVIGTSGTVADKVAEFPIGSIVEVGNSSIGKQYLRVVNAAAGSASVTLTFADKYVLSTNYTSTSVSSLNRYWEFYNVINKAPGTSDYVATVNQTNGGNSSVQDELHVVVIDEDGKFTGSPGTILEVFEGLSRATDAKTKDGGGNFYKDVINNTSRYVWAASDRAGASSTIAKNLTTSSNTIPLTLSFDGGQEGLSEANVSFGTIAKGYDYFLSTETIDISLILQGKALGSMANGAQLGAYLIDNLAEKRKDCIAFISPAKEDVVNNSTEQTIDSVLGFYNGLARSSSYAVMDSGYKYQYDKYNDVYRWIPLNGDVAGLCVRTDQVSDVWYSPGGFNRGQIKNIVKLAWNPSQSERDKLYKNNINPVVSFPGQGTVLFGDKTLLSKPSAFDRINVRRLFITLEKAISTAAKYTLFEFNDEFTRSQFVGLVEPYLRAIQGRRGITDFRVVCDATNNTGEVIDNNQFVGDIYIKPARSINFIQLNFVAVRSGVDFNEVVGRF